MGGRFPLVSPKPADLLSLVGTQALAETTRETRIPGTSARRHARALMLVLLPLMGAELIQGVLGAAYSVLPLYALSVAFAARSGGFAAGGLAAGAAGLLYLVNRSSVSAGVFAWNALAEVLALVVLAWVAAGVTRLASQLRAAERLSGEDPLTEVLNTRGLALCVPREVARCARAAAPLSVAFLDLDHFKSVNDRLGHARGDRVLRSVAATVRATLRTEDVFARVGGDEFVILLPCTGEHDAALAAERVRCAISGTMASEGWRVSASIGVVTWHQPRGSTEAILKRADEAMYAAKRSGGDCVCHLSVASNSLATLAEADRLLRSMSHKVEARRWAQR